MIFQVLAGCSSQVNELKVKKKKVKKNINRLCITSFDEIMI